MLLKSDICKLSLRSLSIRKQLKDYVFPVIRPADCVQQTISGWGPGGQNVNMLRNAVLLKHIPTGITVKVHESRLLQENIKIAHERLKHAVDRHINGESSYDIQLSRLQAAQEEKKKRKKEIAREFRKMCLSKEVGD